MKNIIWLVILIVLLSCNPANEKGINHNSGNVSAQVLSDSASYLRYLGKSIQFLKNNCNGNLSIDTINDEYESWLNVTCYDEDSVWIKAEFYDLNSPVVNTFESNSGRYFRHNNISSFLGKSIKDCSHLLKPLYDETTMYFQLNDSIFFFSRCFMSEPDTALMAYTLFANDSAAFQKKFGNCQIESIKVVRIKKDL